MKQKWYLQTWFICFLFAFWFLILPGIAGFILLILQIIDNKKYKELYAENLDLYEQNNNLQLENQNLTVQNSELYSKLDNLDYNTYEEVKAAIVKLKEDQSQEETAHGLIISEHNATILTLLEEISKLKSDEEKYSKQTNTQINKLKRTKELVKSIDYAIRTYHEGATPEISSVLLDKIEELSPSVILKLHHMDVKDLKKAFRENDNAINSILSTYSARYTTKTNKAIYSLMVIALRAELQNILYNLKYDKLDNSIDQLRVVTAKYLKIAGEGNQSISGTLTRFIGEIEYLFVNAIKIEYNYYVKKEQAKQEQLAIREQMRQEAEERRLLEQEKKRIEKEESKYLGEIEKLNEQLQSANESEIDALNKRILELQSQLSDVTIKKDEITALQNGKAGNVYIISNLGSFGENIFKIGMTRRLDPQDRINELGSASVPFKFDVHSFIFSDNAVDMEKALHDKLNDKRVNKVNLRKEFFNCTIDELDELVTTINPTAEFNRTMIAEEFRQSLSSNGIYDTTYQNNDDDDENLE